MAAALTPQQIQAYWAEQQRQADQQANYSGDGATAMASMADRQRYANQNSAIRTGLGGGMAGGGMGAGGDGSSAEYNRNKMYSLLSGRLGDLKGDPMDELISKQLTDRINGTSQPYDATTTNAYFTNATDQAAASAQAQAGSLRGNPADPAYQAALREIDAGRASAGQQARLSIDSQAHLGNYNAQGQAMGQGAAFNAQRNGAITDQSNRYADTLGRQSFTSYSPGASFGGWQQYNQQPQYQVQTYMQPQQQYQPAQQPAAHQPAWDTSQGQNDSYWQGSDYTKPTNAVQPTQYNPAQQQPAQTQYSLTAQGGFQLPGYESGNQSDWSGYRGGLPQGDTRGQPYNPFPRPRMGY